MKQKDEILTQSCVEILFCEILTLILMRLKCQNNEKQSINYETKRTYHEITHSIMR